MILSFHPLIIKDENRLCAGRQPNAEDLSAIKAADAVILPQGCYRALYDMARNNCRHVFPDYSARFDFPGKTGQARLFQKTGVAHPATEIFLNVAEFKQMSTPPPRAYPLVFKFDWGGEGEGVFLIESERAMEPALSRAEAFEKTGQRGFVLQAYIPTAGRSLRVVVIGNRLISYWRVMPDKSAFGTGVSAGARIDPKTTPELQTIAKDAVADFCRKTGINLAGFDILFCADNAGRMDATPLFLEINYFFGRRGLGGSEAYYPLFHDAVEKWLQSLPGT
ncbi:MAG: hypothetical protein RBT11_03100 [Desulfobacterales bacterium]|jgi:ribosomal protein S6--L-glutamate ligase|nr:hypothetical protein [Desulfobacterales bacterium]